MIKCSWRSLVSSDKRIKKTKKDCLFFYDNDVCGLEVKARHSLLRCDAKCGCLYCAANKHLLHVLFLIAAVNLENSSIPAKLRFFFIVQDTNKQQHRNVTL